MNNFWKKLPKPFFALAPMYDVTDEAFRQMFAKYGKPDVFFTEFVSIDGLLNEVGRKKVVRELYFEENEHPIVAQIFGSDPKKFYEAAKIIQELGFDGIDINMGCPDKTIIKQGAGSALIRKPQLAKEIIESTRSGAPNIPVSVKTRIGYSKTSEMKGWITSLLEAKPALLTVHLRTTKEMSRVKAHFELIPELADIVSNSEMLLMINGDIGSKEEGLEIANKFSINGIMVGRAAFGNPWFFSGETNISFRDKVKALIEHTRIFEAMYLAGRKNSELFEGHTKNFALMKKHFKSYISSFRGSSRIRTDLMKTVSADEVENILENVTLDS